MRSTVVLVCLVLCVMSDAVAQCIDGDGDGYGNPASTDCPLPALDCNDASPSTFPGAIEACDGFDNDCDGQGDNRPECDRTCDPPESIGAAQVTSSSAGFSPGSWPRTAWNGSGFATVWSGHPSGGNDAVFFALSDASGMRTSAELPVSGGAGIAKDPAIAYTGSAYGVVWADSRDGELEIFFTRLGASGQKQLADVELTRDEEISAWPDIAWDGRQFGAVWSGEQGGLYFTTLDLDGHRTSPIVTVSTNIAWPDRAAIVWTGSAYAVVWSGYEDGDAQVFFQRISVTGDLVGLPIGVTANTSSTAANPRLAWSGTRFGVVWYDDRVGGHRVHLALLDPVGAKQGVDLRLSDAVSINPDIESSGEEFAVAWSDARGGVNRKIYLQLVDSGGLPVSAAIPVSSGGATDDNASIVWTGRRYGVSSREQTGSWRVLMNIVGCDCVDGDHDGASRCRDCDDGDSSSFPGAAEACDGRDNDCNGVVDDRDGTADADLDGVTGACDNCPTVRNESQHDADADLQGDECDLDDGLVLFVEINDPRVRWQGDPAYSSCNLYRGSLAVLRATGEYTQEPGSNPYAGRFCGLTVTYQDDGLSPATGEAFYWLVAGVGAGGEEPLGDGAGVDRPNDHPCP